MKTMFWSIALVAISGSAVIAAHNPQWNDFRGSFLIGKEEGFAPFPRTANDPLITEENWVNISSDCHNGGLFEGYQFVRQNDYSIGLLYDRNGTIAGIQMLIPQSVVKTPTNVVNYAAIPMYQSAVYNEQDYYVLTTYLVEPSTICGTGRDPNSVEETGTGLWIQNGTQITQVPNQRPESRNEDENQGWTKNNCFPAMGYHNFYSIKQYNETNCTEMVPIFGLYNHRTKQLHGFGFITVGNIEHPRFEHPPEAAIRLILGSNYTLPCVIDTQKRETLTSLHVYFTANPKLIACGLDTPVDYVRVLVQWFGSVVRRFFGFFLGTRSYMVYNISNEIIWPSYYVNIIMFCHFAKLEQIFFVVLMANTSS